MKNQSLAIALLGLTAPLFSATSLAQQSDAEIINKLQSHYQFVTDLNKLAIDYHATRPTQFQSDHFDSPALIKSRFYYEFDKQANAFTFHDQHIYPGNYIFDNKMVSQQGLTVLYDVNGFTMGKQLEILDYSMADYLADLSEDIDFFSAHELLTNINQQPVTIEQDGEGVALSYKDADGEAFTYRFSLSPVQLLSIRDHANKETTEFGQYRQQGKLTFAHDIKQYRGGKLRRTITLNTIQPIEHIEQQNLEIPQGYGPFIDTQEIPLQWVNIAEDLFLINYVAGDRHVLVKRDEDGLTVFGAPVSNQVSKEVMALIQQKLPTQKVHSVYITHPHSDHIRGLSFYADQGIQVIADQYSIAALKAYPSFKGKAANWRFMPIHHKQTIKGVTYYLPKNSHSHGQSFAYFSQSQIIYQGDFLEIPFDNSLPSHMADTEREFIEFLYSEKLPYKRIVGHHRNNDMQPSIVNAYYQLHHGS